MSGETRLSLFVGLDASKAKAEAAGLKAEVEKLGRAAREAGQGAGSGATALSNLEKSMASAARSGTATEAVLVPLSASAEALGQDIVLVGQGAADAAAGLAVLEAATRGADVAISGVNQTAIEASAATKALKDGLGTATNGATQVGAAMGRARDASGRFVKGAAEATGAAAEFAGAADTAANSANRLGGALPGVIPQTTKLGIETGKAAQSAGMMAAQWNDVVMMTLAGQNPMQLAIQQGTQMTQAFGNAGAGGALRMLGAGFTAMLNPMNLAVIAGIGLGSALVQSFLEAGEAQATAEESLKDYADGFSALEASISAAKGMQSDYAQAVRSGNVIILDALSKEAAARLALMELDKLELAEKARTADQSIAVEEEAFNRAAELVKDRQAQIDRLKAKGAAGTYAGGYATAEEEAGTLLPFLEAETAEMEAQGRALERIRAERDLTKAKIEANTAAEAVARQMLSQIEDGTLAVTTGMSNATGQAQAFAAGLDRASGVLSGIAGKIAGLKLDRISAAAQLAALQAGQTPDAARIAGDVAVERAQLAPLLSAPTGAASFARDQLAALEADATQLAADKAAIAEILKSQSTSEAGSSGGGVKAETNAMADLIAKYRQETEALRALDPIQKALAQNHEALATATEAERDQLITLIAEKERLTAIQDKIQQIGQLGKSAFTGLATGAMTFRSALANVLDGLAQMAASSAWDLIWSGGGKKSGGGLGGLVGDLLGFAVGGGGLGKKAGGGGVAKMSAYADGGPVSGQGGPREDNIPIWASVGEYMVNAAATAANLPLVEAINAGATPRQLAAILGGMMPRAGLPAFADGGRIGGSAPSGWLRTSSGAVPSAAPASTGGEMAVTVNVEGARGNAEILEMVERGVRAGIEAFSRSGLPVRVRQITADPRRMS